MKSDKKVQRIRRSHGRNVSIQDFESLIMAFGCIEEGSKHPKALIGGHTLTYKRENPVKVAYVKELLQIIDSL